MRPLLHVVIVFAVSIASLSAGNLLIKQGMNRFGIVLMTAQFPGTMLLFKWGWDAGVVIPITGLCYVGTTILGKWMLGEPVNATCWFGIALIISGFIFVARSVSQAKVP